MRKRYSVDIMTLVVVSACACLTLMGSCEILNPDESVPAYIHIDSFKVETTQLEGSGRSRITEVWFYADGEYLGAYSLPATIPVIAEGNTEVLLFPGIKDNGIISTPDIYPFLASASYTVDLMPARVDTIQAVTGYKDNTAFAFIEDFENSVLFVDDQDGNPATRITRSQEDVFEGDYSGRIHLDTENDLIEVATLSQFSDLPTNGSDVYLEMHYKNETHFSIGLIGHAGSIDPATYYVITLKPRDFWNKIYINMTFAISQSDLDAYQVVLLARLDDGLDNALIYLDNIKFLHFE